MTNLNLPIFSLLGTSVFLLLLHSLQFQMPTRRTTSSKKAEFESKPEDGIPERNNEIKTAIPTLVITPPTFSHRSRLPQRLSVPTSSNLPQHTYTNAIPCRHLSAVHHQFHPLLKTIRSQSCSPADQLPRTKPSSSRITPSPTPPSRHPPLCAHRSNYLRHRQPPQ